MLTSSPETTPPKLPNDVSKIATVLPSLLSDTELSLWSLADSPSMSCPLCAHRY